MATPQIGRIDAVLTGRAVPGTRPGARTAIAKHVRAGRVRVDAAGVEGDEQGDTRHHGGPDKAVHVYAREHYARWLDELGPVAILQTAGAFGENLSTRGVTESDLCLGDELRIGTARLQVVQGRQPCWKLNDRFGVPDMARRVQQTMRTGWYCRVLEPGTVGAGDAIDLVARPWPQWTLARLLELLYHRRADDESLARALALPLVPSWRRIVEGRLSTGTIEDWSARVDGPSGTRV